MSGNPTTHWLPCRRPSLLGFLTRAIKTTADTYSRLGLRLEISTQPVDAGRMGTSPKMDAVLGGLMEPMELEERVQNLQKRAERLERRQSRFLVGTSVLLAVFLLSAWQSVQAPQENYKTRALSIVDSSGVVRLTLGAPVPNSIVDAKQRSDAVRLQALSLTMPQAMNAAASG
jgi:hypothetical protein